MADLIRKVPDRFVKRLFILEGVFVLASAGLFIWAANSETSLSLASPLGINKTYHVFFTLFNFVIMVYLLILLIIALYKIIISLIAGFQHKTIWWSHFGWLVLAIVIGLIFWSMGNYIFTPTGFNAVSPI